MASNDSDPVSFGPQVLREYALVADGERGGLIGPHGDLVWMCAPRWDSDAVFSALIGGGGAYAVTPADPWHVWGGYYEPDSLIWRSRLGDQRHRDRVPGGAGVSRRSGPDRAAPAGARGAGGRQGAGGTGAAGRVRQARQPRPVPERRYLVRDERAAALALAGRRAGGPHPVEHSRSKLLTLELTVPAGERHDLVLEMGEGGLDWPVPDPAAAWRATESAWAQAQPPARAGHRPADARHAWAVLRGLTGGGGGMVAAATMSLPERADRGRNYDYRYAWIRDQAYAGIAGGPGRRAGSARRRGRVRRRPAAGRRSGAEARLHRRRRPVPSERSLDLTGYPGGTDKTGNWVNQQFQLDALGEALQLLATAARLGRLDTGRLARGPRRRGRDRQALDRTRRRHLGAR